MQRALALTIVSLGILAPALAPAQTGIGTGPRPPKTEAQRVQRFDFDNDKVVGTLIRPEGDLVTGGGKVKHPSLVQARQTFVAEMIKSASNL